MGSKHDLNLSGGSAARLPQQASGSSASTALAPQNSLLDTLADWHIDSKGECGHMSSAIRVGEVARGNWWCGLMKGRLTDT